MPIANPSADKAVTEGAASVIVSAAIESEIAQLDEVDKLGFLVN